MITPFLFRATDGMWHCVRSLNEHTGTFAQAESKDLIYWQPQTYSIVMKNNNCLEPEVWYSACTGQYTNYWLSPTGSKDLIVKLVNMLPVVVNTNIRLDEISDFSASAIRTVLSGIPTDKKLRPVTDQIAVSGEFPCTLPAYSFTVIRIKSKN
jgi:hypothetical protein